MKTDVIMLKYIVLIVAIVCGVFFLSSCTKDSPEDTLREGEEYLAANAKRQGVVTTESGLQYEVLQEGKEGGRRPDANSQVLCRYTGTFINGKKFDSSGKDPIAFPLNGVIKGWTEGLQLMTEGAIYRFVIPYYLAYGPYDYASIPGYSTLIFEVELVQVL